MAFLRVRVTGTETGFDALVNALHGVEGVEHVEEIADLMPHMDDDDSSSAGLPDDTGGALHALEIEAATARQDDLRQVAEQVAHQHGLVLEFVDEF
jgi:hypothetical protein